MFHAFILSAAVTRLQPLNYLDTNTIYIHFTHKLFFLVCLTDILLVIFFNILFGRVEKSTHFFPIGIETHLLSLRSIHAR